MNMTETRRQQLLDDIRELPDEALQKAASFVAWLKQESATPTPTSEATSKTEVVSKQAAQTPYEILKESGLIGCIKDGPSDLSTNYKEYLTEYLEEKHGYR